MSCHLRVGDFEFSSEDVERAGREKGLLSLEVEFSLTCNFACRYCYLQGRPPSAGGLSAEEGRSVIEQARGLGARRIVVLGGEPMLYPQILEMLSFGRGLGLEMEMFTNGSRIDARTAARLFELDVRVVLKRNSFVPEIQDDLAGRRGAHTVIESAYRNLRAAGYPAAGRMLAISSVICRQNRDEILPLWEWIRGEGLVPYIEVITPHAGIPDFDELTLRPEEYQGIFERLADWDRAHGGRSWDPQPPLVGNRCLRHLFSCLVDSEARVLPCVGLPIPVGSLRERSLRDVLADSEVIENLRDFRRTIHGPCSSCARAEGCYGCRGSAYTETGDYLGSDPRCWRNRERQTEIARMPVPAAPLIPQREPMRLVDTVQSVGERKATIGVTIRPGMPFLADDGTLAGAAFLEMMAQAVAALGGFSRRGRLGPEAGLMLGARNLEILGQARLGDQLEIEVFKSARLGGFGIVQGTVRRKQDLLARGELKVLRLEPGARQTS